MRKKIREFLKDYGYAMPEKDIKFFLSVEEGEIKIEDGVLYLYDPHGWLGYDTQPDGWVEYFNFNL